MNQPPTFADTIRAEQARVAAGAPACGHTCPEHELTCIRTEHPHDPDADMGPGRPRGDVVPHVADVDGHLTQWVCTDCPPTRAPAS